MNEIDETIITLELQIDWIEQHTENQIPGWANVTGAIREAIRQLKKLGMDLESLEATNSRYADIIGQMITIPDAEDAILDLTMKDGPEMIWSSDAIDAIKALKGD